MPLVGRLLKQLLGNARRRAAGPAAPALASVKSARALLGRLTAKRDLAAAANARTGPRLGCRFRRYVAWLDRQGYTFASCEELPRPLDQRRVYLRYDVHVRDLFGAFALASLHEELRIPGSFQICWEHSEAEKRVSDLYLRLQLFDSRFVEFGLHCSPESSWIIAERFQGRSEGLEGFVGSGAARSMIAEWLAAFEREGDDAAVLVEARRRAEARLAYVAASFRRRFGPARTLSAHGTPLADAYLKAMKTNPRVARIAGYLHAAEFLVPARFREHGFACELTRLDEIAAPGPRIMFENPIDDMASRYRQRMAGGGGFVVLSHPASWTGDHFTPFLDRVTAPGWPDADPSAASPGGDR